MESRDNATKEGQNNGGIARNVTDGGRRGLDRHGRAKKSGTSLVRNGDKQKFWKRDMKPNSASRSMQEDLQVLQEEREDRVATEWSIASNGSQTKKRGTPLKEHRASQEAEG